MRSTTKCFTDVLAVLLLALSGCATSYSSKGHGLLKDSAVQTVACVGDSITYGSALENREEQSYPVVLGKKLGAGWQVNNYGVPGERAVDYMADPVFTKITEDKPNVIVVMLGANDSGALWSGKEIFEERYSELIKSFQSMTSSPRILICIPYAMASSYQRDSHLRDVIECVNLVAKNNGLEIIRTDKRFWNKTHLLIDGTHPSPKGARMIADEVYRAITYRSAMPQDYLRVIGEYFKE